MALKIGEVKGNFAEKYDELSEYQQTRAFVSSLQARHRAPGFADYFVAKAILYCPEGVYYIFTAID
jgi:hypothetical protein